jgi:hypothetical protein
VALVAKDKERVAFESYGRRTIKGEWEEGRRSNKDQEEVKDQTSITHKNSEIMTNKK